MPPDTLPDISSLLLIRIRVPQHVVYRSFPAETVLLNLNTGRYHGLNTTAGLMLEALEKAPSVSDAAMTVAARLGQPRPDIELDMFELCRLLLDRELIEIDDRPAH
jgi:coenzyme PQQ synthesis protein D (PqqD)